MHGSTLALVLCLAAAPALAQEPASARTAPAEGLVRTSLVVQAQAGPSQAKPQPALLTATPAKPSKAQAEDPAPPPAERRPVLAMLLAALAVMTGIALRRWLGEQR
ncbi:MAG TPA: hypothetical protein VEA40_03050 [Ramlibacter sp.]|nr:hypothetical protein [Ramlibacter sp.]